MPEDLSKQLAEELTRTEKWISGLVAIDEQDVRYRVLEQVIYEPDDGEFRELHLDCATKESGEWEPWGLLIKTSDPDPHPDTMCGPLRVDLSEPERLMAIVRERWLDDWSIDNPNGNVLIEAGQGEWKGPLPEALGRAALAAMEGDSE